MFRKGGYASQAYPKAAYAAMVARLDKYVGEIVEELKRQGFTTYADRFTSDNGPHREGGNDPDFSTVTEYIGDTSATFTRAASVFRRLFPGKDTYLRVRRVISPSPFGLSSHVCRAVGQGTPGEERRHKRIAHVDGEKGQKEHDFFYFEFHELNGRQAVIRGNWKLLHLNIQKEPVYELYNIASDPSEVHNVISLYPEKAEELKRSCRKLTHRTPIGRCSIDFVYEEPDRCNVFAIMR